MGGILDHRGWARSNGGLWLPRLYHSPNEMGFCCCVEDEMPCCTYPFPTEWSVDTSAIWGRYQMGDFPTCNCGAYCDFLRAEFALTYTENITDWPTGDSIVYGSDGWFASGDVPGCTDSRQSGAQVKYRHLFAASCITGSLYCGFRTLVGAGDNMSYYSYWYGTMSLTPNTSSALCNGHPPSCIRASDWYSACEELLIFRTAGANSGCCKASTSGASTALLIRQDV